jgi:hypothetical protein
MWDKEMIEVLVMDLYYTNLLLFLEYKVWRWSFGEQGYAHHYCNFDFELFISPYYIIAIV